MAVKLTAKAVENAKATSSRQEIPDGLLPGLYLVVQPSGAKSWAVRYRHNNRPRKMTLGKTLVLKSGEDAPPQVLGGYLTLAGARNVAREQLSIAAAGRDPGQERQQEKQEQQDEARLFEAVARRFIERYARPKNRSWMETARLLGLVPDRKEKDVPVEQRTLVTSGAGAAHAWKGRRIDEITRKDVVSLLDGIVDEGKPVAANRMLAAVRRMFGWCVERDLLEHSPADRVAAPAPNSSRERVLDEQELAAIWKAAGNIGHPYGHMIRLLILTGLRRQEVAGMEWNELDLDGKLWTIPAARMKKSREQLVPLSDAALKVIAELQKVRIKDAKHAITLNGKKPVNGFSAAKKELDEEVKKVAGGAIDNWTFHDIRRTLSTGLAEMGVNLQVAEKILAHESGSLAGVAGIYNRYTFLEERREALDKWASHVIALEVKEDATAE